MARVSRAVVGTTALAASVALAQLAGPARAVTDTTTTAFVPGTATATSTAFAIAPKDGGLAATITVGRSIADYTNDQTQASSQALDLGLIGSNLTVQCSSVPPAVTAGELPKPLVAESDSGASSSSKSTAGTDTKSMTVATGRESVSAAPPPHEVATADFDGARLKLPGLIDIGGLSSHSYAHLVPGKARIAESTADLASLDLLGGQVQLGGLHWALTVRSGAKSTEVPEFSIESASIGGKKLPTSSASLASTVASINKSLASTGLHLNLPAVTHTHGVVAMTPLSVGIATSPAGSKALNPLLTLVFSQVLSSLVDVVAKAACQVGSVYGAVNLLLASLDGVGSFDLQIGGVTATTDDTTYANPFGDGGTPPAPTIGSGGGTPAASGPTGTSSVPPLPGASDAPEPVPSPQVAGTRTVASSCSTTSPAGRPGCSRGAGLAVALIALATLGGVAGADYLVLRRRRRLTRMAIEP